MGTEKRGLNSLAQHSLAPYRLARRVAAHLRVARRGGTTAPASRGTSPHRPQSCHLPAACMWRTKGVSSVCLCKVLAPKEIGVSIGE